MIKIEKQGFANKLGKYLAKPLSVIVANPFTEDFARLLEAYWCILLGKGSGTGWGMQAEIKAASSMIDTASPVIFDVGANTGEWSLLMKQAFPDARMFLFEPQPDCRKSITEKEISNSTLIPNAVSSSRTSVKLYRDSNTAGTASLHQRRDSYFDHVEYASIDVETVTIDDVVSRYGLSRVDFMKMDIEGHELEALKGAMRSLKNHTIKALSFEFGSGNINSRTFFHDYWDLLDQLDYRLYRILPSARLMHIKEYYEDCEYFRGVSNYVASTCD